MVDGLMMDTKEYHGKIKYLGSISSCQMFKSASVMLSVENGKHLVETRLMCNPSQLYHRHEIKGAEVHIKGQRVILKNKLSTPHFWELHFIGDAKHSNQMLYEDLQNRLSKVTSRSPDQNKAEVGSRTKMETSPKGMLQQVSPKAGQEAESIIFPVLNKDHMYLSLCPLPSSGFTRVKDSRQTSDADEISDDDSKENQHRGPLDLDVDKQNKQGDRKPLQTSSFRFYGSSAPDIPFASPRSKQNTKASHSSTPVTRPEKKKGQFSDFMSTYTWNHSRISPPVETKKQTPQLQGFANIGNTCYMNAILQSLFGLDTFSADLLSLYKQHGRVLTRQSLAVALTRLMVTRQRQQSNTAQKVEEMLYGVKRAISTTAKRFIGSQQHDAHEFLCQVLDQLKEEVIRVTKPREEKASLEDSSPQETATASPGSIATQSSDFQSSVWDHAGDTVKVKDTVAGDRTSPRCYGAANSEKDFGLGDNCASMEYSTNCLNMLVNPTFANFEFEVVHSFECINCHERIQKAEQFNDLSVDIPSKPSGLVMSLQDALDVFFQKEEIDYRCEKCGHLKAEVSHKFAKLPRVLILHLKRYTYNNRNNKMQEKLQLPRFITLRDHCDTKTTPHLPYLLAHSSPLKSPVINSPVKTPVMASPDSRLKRRSFENSENGKLRSPKKVRRSLLAEVGACDDAVVPGSVDMQKPNLSDDDPEITFRTNEQSARSKTELSPLEIEDYDEQLQKALDLSRMEYEANSMYWEHSYVAKSDGHGGQNNNTQEDCTDLTNLTEEEQIRLAISRSLESFSPSSQAVPDGADCLTLNMNTGHQPTTDSLLLKLSVSPQNKEGIHQGNLREDTLTQSNTANFLSEASRLDFPGLGLRSFTNTSDFMHDAHESRTSPESTHISDLSQQPGQTFTSCKHPLTQLQCVDHDCNNQTSSAYMFTHIGSVGALSKSSSASGIRKSEKDVSPDSSCNSDEDRKMLPNTTRPVFTSQQDNVSPAELNSSCRPQDKSPVSPILSANTEQWTPEEEKKTATNIEEDLDDICNTFAKPSAAGCRIKFSAMSEKKCSKQGSEEKENLSPPDGKSRNGTELPLSKEMEAKQLQHKLRQTEIEKGLFPHSYRLVSIVSHHGATSTFGHYVSDVYDIKKQTWFSIDDKHVEKTTESFVRTNRTSSGYIFFYLTKRRGRPKKCWHDNIKEWTELPLAKTLRLAEDRDRWRKTIKTSVVPLQPPNG